jgi:hypothetical protein
VSSWGSASGTLKVVNVILDLVENHTQNAETKFLVGLFVIDIPNIDGEIFSRSRFRRNKYGLRYSRGVVDSLGTLPRWPPQKAWRPLSNMRGLTSRSFQDSAGRGRV